MLSRLMRVAAVLSMSVWLLNGCSSASVEYKYPEKVRGRYEMPGERTKKAEENKLFGPKGLKLFSEDTAPETHIGVNSYLWQSALSTLSFMPLASADPFGGVIVTDWYSPDSSPDERFKLNVLILTKTLRADGLKVSVFRQVRDEKKGWTDTKSDPDVALRTENAILAGARKMRLSATGQ